MSDLSISDRSDIGPAVAQWPDRMIPKFLWRKCEECKEPVDDLDKTICDYCERTTDERDTRYLDDPKRGQAAHINSMR